MFKDIKGYEGVYAINTEGSVMRLSTGRLIKVNKCQLYLYVTLSMSNVQKRVNIHRAIAEAFINNPSNKEQVNHINGIKHDNRLENLEWATRSENAQHAWNSGLSVVTDELRASAARNGRLGSMAVIGVSKSSGDTIEYNSASDAARSIGGSQGNISWCCLGKKKSCYGYFWSYK